MSEAVAKVVGGGWPALGFLALLFALSLAAFGVMPGLMNRIFARLFPATDPRRREMIAELYTIPMRERPWWVCQQAERAVFEGLSARLAIRRSPVSLSDDQVKRLASRSEPPWGRIPPEPATFRIAHGRKRLDDASLLRIAYSTAENASYDTMSLACGAALAMAMEGRRPYSVKRGRFASRVIISVYGSADENASSAPTRAGHPS